MAGASSKLQILIEAKNQASSQIKQVEGDLKGLDKAAGSIAGGLGSLAGAAGVAGIAALGTAAAGAVVEMAKGAAEAERLGTAFDNLASSAGQSGDAMLSAMQEASKGTISNADLMLQANTAMMLGVADSADEMSKLLEVASARGKAFGVSTADAFAALTEGLGRMSPEILNNIGIVINAQKTYADYAASIGKTADQLSDAEKKQALVNTVIKSSTDLINDNKIAGDDAASNFERMDASITNAKDALGQLFSPAVAAIAQSIADATNKAVEATKEYAAKTSDAAIAQDNATMSTNILMTQLGTLRGLMSDLEQAGQTNTQAYRDLQAQTQALGAELLKTGGAAKFEASAAYEADLATRSLTTSTQASANSLPAYQAGLAATARALQETALMANLAQEAFNALRAEQTSGSGAIAQAAAAAGALFAGKLGGDAGLAKQQAVSQELDHQRDVWMDMGYTQKEINDVLLPGMIQSMSEADRATFSTASHVAQISDEAKAANQAFEDLKGTVSGVLQGALDPGVGVDPSALLPRQDAINEDARRLADVAVNGFASPWAEYFRKEFPDQFQEMAASNDIKTGAAIMLRNFQDGLEPELINKDLAKERVRKMLIGDANMGALTQEIAQELAGEMGIPLQQALAAAQGTLGGSSGAGTEAASSFADGAMAALDEGNGGGSFVSKFADQARASYGLLASAGKDAGKTWGSSFLEVVGENVPPALVKILVDLTTPGIIAQLAQKGSLTAAAP